MVEVVAVATRGVLVLDAAILLGVATYALTRRDEPGATPFAAVTLTLAVGAAAVAALGRIGGPRSLSWALVASLLLVFVTCWLWFVASYTGQGGYSPVRMAKLLAVVPAVGVVTIAYLYLSGDPIPRQPTARGSFYVTFFFVPSMFVGALFLGSVLTLLRSGVRYASADLPRSVALSVGALGGGLLPLVSVTLEARAGMNAAPGFAAATLVASAGFGLAVVRYDLFESLPIAEVLGRDRLVATMDDPVVVVDSDERVVDCNDAAAVALDVSRPAVVGQSVSSLLDVAVPVEEIETVEIDGEDGRRVYEASVADVSDDAGRVVGHGIVLRDVTDRQTRRQRLEVLNRVLRHNLRNDMTTVMGYADLIAEDRAESEAFVERINETADELTALGDKAREIEGIMAASDDADAVTDLSRLVQYVASEARTEYPDADVTVDLGEGERVAAAEEVCWPVVWNLVENAVEHHDGAAPAVTIRTRTTDDDRAAVTVVDDGPGIPDTEREAILTGTERPLAHGSGLGLWAVKWGANRVGGEVAIENADPRGTRVTVRFPLANADAAPAAEPVERA